MDRSNTLRELSRHFATSLPRRHLCVACARAVVSRVPRRGGRILRCSAARVCLLPLSLAVFVARFVLATSYPQQWPRHTANLSGRFHPQQRTHAGYLASL